MNDTATPTAAELRHAFEDRIGADRDLKMALDAVLVAALDARDAETEAQIVELARHFPGIAPALVLVWREHIIPQHLEDIGRCCQEMPL
jgi:hypothetical protein